MLAHLKILLVSHVTGTKQQIVVVKNLSIQYEIRRSGISLGFVIREIPVVVASILHYLQNIFYHNQSLRKFGENHWIHDILNLPDCIGNPSQETVFPQMWARFSTFSCRKDVINTSYVCLFACLRFYMSRCLCICIYSTCRQLQAHLP